VLANITCIERILPLFAVTVTANDIERHKPNPDPFQKAVSALGAINPFVFEDSLPGALSANRANLPFAIHKHAANTHAARIILTMKHFDFTFEDYHDTRIQKLLTIS
jgi:beta-phosphoglucomutase-like phosphatase (HAD superfamily)